MGVEGWLTGSTLGVKSVKHCVPKTYENLC